MEFFRIPVILAIMAIRNHQSKTKNYFLLIVTRAKSCNAFPKTVFNKTGNFALVWTKVDS
jgi:hypothetical protein